MPNSPFVRFSVDHGIGTVLFSTPQGNSMPKHILGELAHTIEAAGHNDEVKVIVLKSTGDRVFCAGASFDELMAIDNETDGHEFFMGFANVINAMRKCSKFIVARVQGKTVGGGVGLAASADYCFATQFAAIKLSEITLGIGPFVVAPAIERKIGVGATSQVAIDATKFYDAQWAHAKGLYNELFDDMASMDEAVDDLAQKLATYSPDAMGEMKKAFWAGADHWDELLAERAAISGRLVLSDYTKSFIQGFKNKKKG